MGGTHAKTGNIDASRGKSYKIHGQNASRVIENAIQDSDGTKYISNEDVPDMSDQRPQNWVSERNVRK